ncbi:MAG: zf-HC2 domain-containing protein [Candidatus Aminicenantes bacterium]|nr:MAG: zf-HC2 domain-containing protein [Candidatus Aminicenantes bacterium]
MKNCKYEALIDDYLLNRLAEDRKDEFEEHYFNCPECFEKIEERDEIISVIQNKGHMIFEEEYIIGAAEEAGWFEKIASFLTPKQWALATISAALLLVIVFGVIPNLKTTSPQFFINEDAVRGQKIDLISPVIDIRAVPSKFEWKKSPKDVEYKIYIFSNGDLLWSASTKENFIVLPEEVRKLMTSGEKYSWQVKAFSPEGTLVSVSSRVQFKISSQE